MGLGETEDIYFLGKGATEGAFERGKEAVALFHVSSEEFLALYMGSCGG